MKTRTPKNRLTSSEEQFYRELLERQRRSTQRAFGRVTSQLRRLYENVDDLDEDCLADGNEEVLCWLSAHEKEEWRSIEAALKRLDVGRYGFCLYCGHPIHNERLEALPEVASCLLCQELIEEGMLDPEPPE